MSFKRILSKFLDIIIPFIVSGIGYLVADSQGSYAARISNIIPITMFMSISYLVLNLFSIIFSKGRSLGEIILKIKPVKIRDDSFSYSRVLFREVCYSFFLIYMFIYNGGWIGFLLLSVPIVKLKNEKYLLMVIDFIFGLKYEDT